MLAARPRFAERLNAAAGPIDLPVPIAAGVEAGVDGVAEGVHEGASLPWSGQPTTSSLRAALVRHPSRALRCSAAMSGDEKIAPLPPTLAA
jgi:hypothetical protein